ncbi:MAG: hypothetical protein U0931_29745 [Vulcanimicrobiota bacterium]
MKIAANNGPIPTQKLSVSFNKERNCYDYSQTTVIEDKLTGSFSSSSSTRSVFRHNLLKEGGVTAAALGVLPAAVCALTGHYVGAGVSLVAGLSAGAGVAAWGAGQNKRIDQEARQAGFTG